MKAIKISNNQQQEVSHTFAHQVHLYRHPSQTWSQLASLSSPLYKLYFIFSNPNDVDGASDGKAGTESIEERQHGARAPLNTKEQRAVTPAARCDNVRRISFQRKG